VVANRSKSDPVLGKIRLSGEDLTFWWVDSPMQPTTMAMLMVLDRPLQQRRLEAAFERAVAAVPRLQQRVAEAPLDLTLPHWERDPTFDLAYHVRHHALPGRADMRELLREIAVAYETPFDRSRPLWEARIYSGLRPRNRAAMFFKLHHAVADGVGGNAIFAALTDAEREPPSPLRRRRVATKGAWPQPPGMAERFADAVRDRARLDLERAGAVAGAIVDTIEHPRKALSAVRALRSMIESMTFDSGSPLRGSAGRARRLSGCELPFAEVRQLKTALGGAMIDVILTIMARAMGRWHAEHGLGNVRELMTLVPVNLRRPEDWAEKANVGNVATGILVPLPIRLRTALATYREVHRRMTEKKADPATAASPILADVLSVLPRQLVTWMAEATFGNIDFIVTNVPGILVPRYLAGAEIASSYPFAPVALKSPLSVALYGYRDRLFIGLDSDDRLMPDVERFQALIRESFEELSAAVRQRPKRPGAKR
jgi:WS/DGAT/MGAT family acyltransferase